MNDITWKQIDDLKKMRPERKDFVNEEEYHDALDRHARRAKFFLGEVIEDINETTLGRQKIALETYTQDISDEIYASIDKI